tara:strand:+ start:131 stop:436 length:306 start_codon:yes stop_codon:yes gene_type:complete
MEKIEFKVLRQRVSRRGGGIEIDLTPFGYKYMKMTAYQNYLGGGLLGSINNDCTIRDWEGNPELTKIAEKLSRYFHSLTNPDDEYEGMSFEDRQSLPLSAY